MRQCPGCLLLAAFSVVHIFAEPSGHMNYSAESRLVRDLIQRLNMPDQPYTPTRPVRDAGSPVNIQFGVDLIKILHFDTKNQIITTLVWKHYSWTDEILKWNPEDYEGLNRIRISSKKVWTPDIVLFNSVETGAAESHTENVVLAHTGFVIWMPSWIYHAPCEVNSENFPFDKASCAFKFGSWTHDRTQIDLYQMHNESGFNLESYSESSLWKIDSNSGTRMFELYECCGTYSTVLLTVKLRRVAGMQTMILLLPATSLPLLAIFMFWIPPERPDRVTLGVSLFSAFFLLLLLMADYTPPEAVCNFGYFCGMNMSMIGLAIISSVIAVNCHRRQPPVPPRLSRILIDIVGVALCVTKRQKQRFQAPECQEVIDADALNSAGKGSMDTSKTRPGGDQSCDTRYTWKNVTLVLDRLMFLCYIFGLIMIFIFLFPRQV